ncbi:MAG: type II toxin-antitoxin system Phd/YefM family antitoxin [Candidatus Thiosymbion ectosymbiont of Robbea hypermnestra]|nr:type II toxin-antitoxin system Phd/YefM family antitoxin [Candidatus Thiosymbion ectosymbiont of Robbea hypermnestra]
MDFVSVRDFRTEPGAVWQKLAQQHELVVTRNGKPFAVLTETSPTELDQDLQALRGLRFGRALDAIRTQARAQGVDKMTLDEINAVIREVREERRHEAGA